MVLGQLGNRVQHALRAFTPDDVKVVRATADTFPRTDLYDVEEELTRLGTGEALITALDLKGRPMPTARTMMRPPMSLMAQVDASVFAAAVAAASPLVPTYLTDTDPESAKELLAERMERAEASGNEALEGVEDPEFGAEGPMRPTGAPEGGVDWRDIAQEGARFAQSGTFNTILRSVLGILTNRR